jgi:broad specificity phosphatase PhoE
LFDDWNALADKDWLSHRIVHNAETGEEMNTRFLLFLRELAMGYTGKTILVVSHGDMMRNLLVHLGWGSHIELRGNTIVNTAYIKLETDGVDFFVTETKGITKNEGTAFSLHGQGNS